MSRFAVVGATSWGVTLASLLAGNGHQVSLVVRDGAERDSLRSARGLERLPEVRLPEGVAIVTPGDLTRGTEGLVVAVPAQALRITMSDPAFPRDVPVLSAAKGIEHATGAFMSDILEQLGWPRASIAALSGPNLAHEVGAGLPAAAVVAGIRSSVAESWQAALSSGRFRVYTSRDLRGVEFAGAAKNVIAIAAGAADGLGSGANAIAALMTRGLAEMSRLGVALGADAATFQGLAGIGDLAATCFSPLSRNRTLGQLLARGATPEEALAQIGQAVEGAATAPVMLQLARKKGVVVPIAEEVTAVLSGEKSVPEAMRDLLLRELRSESRP